jgi:hypothetical protein
MKFDFKIMRYIYQLNEADYLDFQLFTISQTARFDKRKKNGKIFLAGISLIIASYFFYQENKGTALYFGVSALALFLFYPLYFKWRQKIHYTKHIRANYPHLFGKTESIEPNSKGFTHINSTGQGQIKVNDINHFDETPQHIFINLTSGMTIIVPKSSEELAQLKIEFQKFNKPYHQYLKWKW